MSIRVPLSGISDKLATNVERAIGVGAAVLDLQPPRQAPRAKADADPTDKARIELRVGDARELTQLELNPGPHVIEVRNDLLTDAAGAAAVAELLAAMLTAALADRAGRA